jgi:hypothetical protein
MGFAHEARHCSSQAYQPVADLMSSILDCRNISSTTRNHACGDVPVAQEDRSPGLLDKVLVLGYGIFCVFIAVTGSLWMLEDLSATLLPVQHVH